MILISLTMAAALAGAAPPDRKAACDAALVVFDNLQHIQMTDDPKRPTIVESYYPINGITVQVDLNRDLTNLPDPNHFLHNDWNEGPMSFAEPVPLKQPPQRELLDRLEQMDLVAALGACASFRTYLTNHHIKHGHAAVNAATRGRRGAYDVEILSLSLPVLSRDGTEAITIEHTTTSDTEGGESAILLRRAPDGKWFIAGNLSLAR